MKSNRSESLALPSTQQNSIFSQVLFNIVSFWRQTNKNEFPVYKNQPRSKDLQIWVVQEIDLLLAV